jgi:valyl-tRNA synthetase
MNGYNVEWIPGFDHAGIATQSVVTRQVQKLLQSDSKEAVDMDKQLRSFSDKNLASIRGQLKSMGTLLDWESTYYTLDEV